MIIFNKKAQKYYIRVFKNLIQNWGFYLALILIVFNQYMKLIEMSDRFNFISIFAILLLSCKSLFYAFYESVIHVQRIEIKNNSIIEIEFLKYNRQSKISEEIDYDILRYRVRHYFRIGLADRLSFIKNHRVLITQYFAGCWNRKEMNDIIIKLNNHGFKKPYGENAQKLIVKNNP